MKNDNILKAKVYGLKDTESVNKLKKAILAVSSTKEVKAKSRRTKVMIEVENSKTIDLAIVYDAINNAGFTCKKLSNY